MAALQKTVLEVLLLGAIGFVFGVGANAVRGSGSLRWTKNYFDRGPAGPSLTSATSEPTDDGRTCPADSAEAPSRGQTTASKFADYPYRMLTFEQAVEVFNHPDRKKGLYVFVDARSKAAYDEGHIEGAIRCDPYGVQDCIDRVLECANGAEKVIVYCHGGDCEDSFFMCRELQAADISCDAICIYAGGLEEWQGRHMPVGKVCD